MRSLFLVAILCFLIASCDQERRQTKELLNKKTEVYLYLNTNTSDYFAVNFLEMIDGERSFTYDVKEKIEGNNNLVFKSVHDLKPKYLIIDIGREHQKEVVIDSIIIKHKTNNLVVYGEDLDRYFILNKYISFNNKTKTVTTKSLENAHFPVMYLRQPYLDKLFNLK